MSKTSQENKKKKLQKEQQPVEEHVTDLAKPLDPARQAQTESQPVELSADPDLNREVVTPEVVAAEDVSDIKAKTLKTHGKKYLKAKAKIDVLKSYPLNEAVQLVKDTSFAKFAGKVEAHITTFDIGNVGEITFPHLEAASKKIVVLNDTVLGEIKDGKLDFDILIATPATMPKLLPFARLLGPKGLMPNPKNGTLTDKPEEAVKRLSVAKETVKTEKKAPVIHIVVGKVDQPAQELAANVEELIKVVKPNKIKKLSLCATMGPSVKVAVEK
jgi:large subunit ribosomal protein L1